MTKKARIERLEQQVAQLEARIIALEARPFPGYGDQRAVVTFTQPNIIWPYEITSHMVNFNDDLDAAKALYQNRQELYVN